MDPVTLLFSFSGRINRAKYWLAALYYLLAASVMALGAFGIASVASSPAAMIPLFVLFGIFFVVSSIAVALKRLHDREKSWEWLIIFYLLPGIFDASGRMATSQTWSVVFGLASAVLSIWAFVELGLLRGTDGSNEYGPDPLGGGYGLRWAA